MTEIIVRLTPEQERLLRLPEDRRTATELADLLALRRDLENQARAALALYDQLVAEARKADDQ